MTGFGDIKSLLQTAQKVQAEIARVKQELGTRTITGESGGGMVRCVVNGKGEILSIEIDPALFAPDGNLAAGQKMIADLVVGAVNLALDKAREMAEREMAQAAGGLVPPGLLGQ